MEALQAAITGSWRRRVRTSAVPWLMCALLLLAACGPAEVRTFQGFTAEQWYAKGRGLWQQGRYSRAKEAALYFTHAIELDSDFKQAYNSRGIAYSQLERYHLALEDFEEAIDLDENYKNAHNNRGVTYELLGDLDDALEDFDRAIEIDSEYAAAYNNRGNIYRAMRMHARAIAEYDRAVAIDPGYGRAFSNRAEAHFALRKKANACKDKRAACELGLRRSCRAVKRKC
jgi:tetratricopeptide (TPR) repeat protein